jgi:hypothetical protein
MCKEWTLTTNLARTFERIVDHNQIIALGGIDTSRVLATLGRLSLVKPVRLGDDEGAGAISLHFEGNGWKLSGLNLPAKAVQGTRHESAGN